MNNRWRAEAEQIVVADCERCVGGYQELCGHCVEQIDAVLRLIETRVEHVAGVLRAILNYPGIREYIGALLYDRARAALGEDTND